MCCGRKLKHHPTSSRVHRTALFIHAMLAFAFCFPGFAQSSESILDYVMEQQEAALRSIHSSCYQLEYYSHSDSIHEDNKRDQQTITRVLSRTVQGEYMRIDQLETVINNSVTVPDQLPYLETRKFAVVNEKYAAFRMDGLVGGLTMRLQVHEHASPSLMLRGAKTKIQYQDVNLFDYAYGLGSAMSHLSHQGKTSIRNYRDDLPGQFSARKITEDGQVCYEVFYTHPRSKEWDIKAVIDPNRGFMTTKLNLDLQPEDSDNYHLGEYTVTPLLTDEGIWVPAKLELVKDERLNPTYAFKQELRIRATSIEVNIDIDPIIFTKESLGYSGRTWSRIDEAGDVHRMTRTSRGTYLTHQHSPRSAVDWRAKRFQGKTFEIPTETHNVPDTEASTLSAQEGSSSASRTVGGLMSAGLLILLIYAIVLIRRGA